MWDQTWTLLEQRTFQDIQILPSETQQPTQLFYFQPVNKGFVNICIQSFHMYTYTYNIKFSYTVDVAFVFLYTCMCSCLNKGMCVSKIHVNKGWQQYTHNYIIIIYHIYHSYHFKYLSKKNMIDYDDLSCLDQYRIVRISFILDM